MASVIGYNHAETIEKLERLNKLETVTAEQRIRIEKYRTMYETLKAEHEQMEDDKFKQSNELQQIKEEMKALQSKCQELVSQARVERDLKVDECEELKLKIMTPQKMELVKIKLLEEVELPYRQKIEALEVEVDRYRNEFNHLRYDYSFLKSEYEHELAQKKTVMDEICAKFELEKEALQNQITSLTDEINSKTPGDMHKLRLLQKENTQLNLNVKSLTEEVEELRNKNESTNMQTDQASRLQARQLLELSMQCKSLESEKDTAKLQLERVQKELEISIREQDSLSTDLHKMERENLQLKSHTEELIHSHKMDLNNIKLNLTKDRCELEQEKDRLQTEMNFFKSKVTIMEANIAELKKDLEQKEHAVIKRVQHVREEEWGRINKLECEKTQLESQVSSLEQQKLDIQNLSKSLHEQLDDCQKEIKVNENKHSHELNHLKSTMNAEKEKYKNLEQEIEKLLDIKVKYQRLLPIHENVLSSEQEMSSELDKTKQSVELIRKELNFCQGDLHKQRELHQKNINEIKRKSDDAKIKLQGSFSNLQKDYKDMKNKYEKLSHTAKKKIKKLKSEVDILNLHVEELKTKDGHHELEKQALMKNLTHEQERMRRKFDRFRHRQLQFSQVLNASNYNALENFSADLRKNNDFLHQDVVAMRSGQKASIADPLDTALSENDEADI